MKIDPYQVQVASKANPRKLYTATERARILCWECGEIYDSTQRNYGTFTWACPTYKMAADLMRRRKKLALSLLSIRLSSMLPENKSLSSFGQCRFV